MSVPIANCPLKVCPHAATCVEARRCLQLMKTGACAKCGSARPLANLVVTASGLTICPEELAAKNTYDSQHQVHAPAPPAAVFPVTDVPRPKKRRAA